MAKLKDVEMQVETALVAESPTADLLKEIELLKTKLKQEQLNKASILKDLEVATVRPVDPITTTQPRWVCSDANKQAFMSYPKIRKTLIKLFKLAPKKQRLARAVQVKALSAELGALLADHISTTMSKKQGKNHRWIVKGLNLQGHDLTKLQPHDLINITLIHDALLDHAIKDYRPEPFKLHYTVSFRAAEFEELIEEF